MSVVFSVNPNEFIDDSPDAFRETQVKLCQFLSLEMPQDARIRFDSSVPLGHMKVEAGTNKMMIVEIQ